MFNILKILNIRCFNCYLRQVMQKSFISFLSKIFPDLCRKDVNSLWKKKDNKIFCCWTINSNMHTHIISYLVAILLETAFHQECRGALRVNLLTLYTVSYIPPLSQSDCRKFICSIISAYIQCKESKWHATFLFKFTFYQDNWVYQQNPNKTHTHTNTLTHARIYTKHVPSPTKKCNFRMTTN